jgi:DNA polymerase IV
MTTPSEPDPPGIPGGMLKQRLDVLFIDFDSFFASCEQQRQPHLRGRPVGVIPVATDSTCCIAASYEAKAFGVKTGTPIRDARRLCPGIAFVLAEHRVYIEFQQKALEAIDLCAPVWAVHSIDELSIKLCPRTRERREAVKLGEAIKASLAEHVGAFMRCSVGIAPNRFLAKTASNLDKPNGLCVLDETNIPERLFALDPKKLTGVGNSMRERLAHAGIDTVGRLYQCSQQELRAIWKSVLGELWWTQLRGGADWYDRPSSRQSVSHGHVMDPSLRTPEGARSLAVRLLTKACVRLRDIDYHATRMTIFVRYEDGHRWATEDAFEPSRDSLVLQRVLARAWKPPAHHARPKQVIVVLSGLTRSRDVEASLFDQAERSSGLSDVFDRITRRYGYDAIYTASMHAAKKAAPRRISFGNIPDLSIPDAEV